MGNANAFGSGNMGNDWPPLRENVGRVRMG